MPEFDFDAPDDQWLERMREALRPEPLAQVGEYELLEEISRGGQGVVYRAQRRWSDDSASPDGAPVAHPSPQPPPVAIKRLLGGIFASPAARRRFEREVEAASTLNHPGIISVFGMELAVGDGVVPAGSGPMIAMEWVDGRPVNRWAQDRSVEQNIDMVLLIADAVQHAHQRGVIHRDLKPSNILVDAHGQPHVLDFGLAKLATDENTDPGGRDIRRESSVPLTLSEQFVGTTAYASPEQLRGGTKSVDTRSDVFSIGVILFEMLTGRRPFAGGDSHESSRDPPATLRMMESSTQMRPSSLRAGIRPELDLVLSTALAFDPEHRYQSMDAFAADLRRYRQGEPVLARGPGAWYLLRLMLRRHRVAATFVATAFALVLIGAVVAGVLASNLSHARRQEHAARETAEQTSGLLQEILKAADPMGKSGPDTTARQLFDAAAARMDSEPPASPHAEAALRNTLGLAYHNLGLWDQAERQLEHALALRRELYPAGHPDLANSMNSLAVLRYAQRRLEDAERLSRAALALHERTLGSRSAEVAEDLNNLGAILRAQGRLDEATETLSKALWLRSEVFPADTRGRAETLTNLAGVLRAQQRYAEAEPLLRDVLSLRRGALGHNHPDVAQSLDNLAVIIATQGRYKEAAAIMQEALSIYRDRLGADHPDTATSLANLGAVQYRAGDLESGIASLRECLQIREALLPADDARLLATLSLLSTALMDLGRVAEAEPLMRRIYESHVRTNSWSEEGAGRLVDQLIHVYESLGRGDEAERFRNTRRQHPPPDK